MKKLMIAVMAFALSTACGMFKVRDKQESEVKAIKKVAIVSFSAYLPQSAKVGLNLSSGKLGATEGGSLIPQNSENIDQMYEEFAKSLKANLGWNVYKTKDMIVHPGYTNAFRKTMEGWQNKMGPGEGTTQFLVKGVMDYDGTRILDTNGRDELINDLGVDAIITARVDVMLNGTKVLGIGARHPQSRVSFQVHTKGKSTPVWFDGGVDGDEMESVGSTGFIDNGLLEKLALQSAKSAYTKIR